MLNKFLVAASIGALAAILTSCGRQPTADAPSTLTVTIDNVQPRRDMDGQIIDAHGGCIQYFNGLFYLYGTAYGTNLDSLNPSDHFVAYSSPDLQQWKFEGTLIPNQPVGVYTRPYVIYNDTTHKYVLWYNWFPKLWDGQAGVATSDSPIGPFTVVTPAAHLAGVGPGDGSLFKDDDGTAYYIYTDMKANYTLRIEQLTPDYLDSNGNVSPFFANWVEAPVMFRRNNTYYVLTGPLCADCQKGNAIYVLTGNPPAPQLKANPDWSFNGQTYNGDDFSITNVNEAAARIILQHPTIHAQQTWVLKIPTRGEPIYIWMGDRWESTPDGKKGHDFQYWNRPLQFDGERILPLTNEPGWEMTWQKPLASH